MKRFYTILCVLILSAQGFSQQLPLDFNNSNNTFTPFSNSGFSFQQNPVDMSDDVGQFFNDGSDPWQGFFIDLSSPINLNDEQQLTLDFYQFDPISHSITLKLENGTDPDVEVTVSNSSSGWTNGLVFDFSSATVSGVGTTVFATGSYSRLTLFIDGGVTQAGTYLIDDINNGSTATDPNALDVIYTDLVWSDDFSGSSIDATKWHHQTIGPNNGQWFNNEEQHYTDSNTNSFVNNGNLHIVAKRETITQNGVTLPFSSARLNSKFAFTYGRVDVRAKLPAGNGTWPAIWTLGKNIIETGAYWTEQGFGSVFWPACGELDIMEHGLHATNVVSSAIHTPSSSGNTVNTSTYPLTDVANDYHIYSMNWSPNQITFLVDGVGYYTYNPAVKDPSTWPFDLDQYLILNVAMGGFAGMVDASFTESEMLVDYVEVYQNVLSIDESVANPFVVYPNPTQDRLYIKTSNQTISQIDLYNNLGQLVFSKSGHTTRLNVSDYNTGIYILKIQSNDKVVSKKVVISR